MPSVCAQCPRCAPAARAATLRRSSAPVVNVSMLLRSSARANSSARACARPLAVLQPQPCCTPTALAYPSVCPSPHSVLNRPFYSQVPFGSRSRAAQVLMCPCCAQVSFFSLVRSGHDVFKCCAQVPCFAQSPCCSRSRATALESRAVAVLRLSALIALLLLSSARTVHVLPRSSARGTLKCPCCSSVAQVL